MKQHNVIKEDKLELAGYDYKLKTVRELKGDEDNPLYGYYSSNDFELLIDADSPKWRQRLALCHELTHGALEHAGLGRIDNQEQLVEAIAYGLCSVKINGKRYIK